MALPKTQFIWMNGVMTPWDQATLHVLSHVVHYGTSWFEGIRSYKTKRGTAIFRLREHMRRLELSAKIYHTTIPYSLDELCNAVVEIVLSNDLEDCYIRPVVYRGYGDLGVYPLTCPIDVVVAGWKWGKYLGKDALEQGVDVCVSSWQRLSNASMPPMAKAGGNYLNSQLIRMEALQNGYAEGIGLDDAGNVSEGSGENIFLVQDGILYTPPVSAAILQGVTRSSVIEMAKELEYTVVETAIPRTMLYTADEIFFTGTAVEITPVRSVDRISVGAGEPGPITRAVQEKFFEVVQNGEDKRGWLTFV